MSDDDLPGREISDEDSAEQEQDDLEMLAADTGMGEAVGEDDDGDGPIDKNSHRAIPAWEEAIGYIVSVNMESRAKNPKAGAPRGAGPRPRPRRRPRGNSPQRR